ncbi:MAG: preprotein translocase subunit YajC [Flavobacteriia bacterium]|jgi:preprotein translocase subunit YajC|nr:preprotein translocase subunit YajC [Cryomorphaceae bacterium]
MNSQIIMLVMILGVFYFFMIRPQVKRQKEAKKLRESLKPGDKVVTIGGIHGKVLEVADSTVLISSEGSKIRVEKSAISSSSEDRLMA